MPTNDERREVAARLREPFDVLPQGRYYHASHTLFGMGLYTSSEVALRLGVCRLADLIEPEERTCERGIEMFSHAYPNEIVCDSDCVSTYVFPLTCGHEVELLENKWPSYCPHCGARVVADA